MDAERIPDDIEVTARRIIGMDLYEGDVFGQIARAILAERSRCASLCRDGDYDSEMRAYGAAFADIIEGKP